ncbi:hypothetical protein BKA80DRAFT_116794 [Phyllosticta citrichinensis]
MKNGRQGARDGIRGEQQRGFTTTSRVIGWLRKVGPPSLLPVRAVKSTPQPNPTQPTGSIRYDRHPTAALQGLSTCTKTRQGQPLAHHPHISRCQVRSLGAPSPHHCRCCNSGHQPDARASTAGLSRRRQDHILLLACHIHSPPRSSSAQPLFLHKSLVAVSRHLAGSSSPGEPCREKGCSQPSKRRNHMAQEQKKSKANLASGTSGRPPQP